MDDINNSSLTKVMAEATAYLEKVTDYFAISLDLDSIDPKDAPGVGIQVADGLRSSELIKTFKSLENHPKIVALDVVEYNAQRDIEHKTANTAWSLINSIYPFKN